MSSAEPDPAEPKPEKPEDNAPGTADVIALGIGCLVFVIFFVAIVMVAMTRE